MNSGLLKRRALPIIMAALRFKDYKMPSMISPRKTLTQFSWHLYCCRGRQMTGGSIRYAFGRQTNSLKGEVGPVLYKEYEQWAFSLHKFIGAITNDNGRLRDRCRHLKINLESKAWLTKWRHLFQILSQYSYENLRRKDSTICIRRPCSNCIWLWMRHFIISSTENKIRILCSN